MSFITFEWDPRKAQSNLRKHGVSFEEAQTVFSDVFAAERFDPDHSTVDERFIMIGMSSRQRVLVVSHAPTGLTIRIISARRAEPRETRQYEDQKRSR
jgi:uncharacterized DUF497 family protein